MDLICSAVVQSVEARQRQLFHPSLLYFCLDQALVQQLKTHTTVKVIFKTLAFARSSGTLTAAKSKEITQYLYVTQANKYIYIKHYTTFHL